MRIGLSGLGLLLLPILVTATGCGGSEDDASSSPMGPGVGGGTGNGGAAGTSSSVGGNGGAAGKSTSAGGSNAHAGNGGSDAAGHAGQAGSGGGAGKGNGGGGSAGKGGGSGGTSAGGAGGTSAGGAAGKGGGAAGVGGGSPGAGGSGPGGKAGVGGGGSGGSSGAGGGGACKLDSDCVPPDTTPPNCAHGVCDKSAHTCTFTTVDADGDGHPTSSCKANDGSPIVLGDDCDDTNKNTHPGAWDGPAGEGHPDECDGIDQSCDGLTDNGKLTDGTSCTCAANDVQKCSTDSGGQPITWPTGTPVGACKYGSQTCLGNGTWGPCTGAVVPTQETCNHVDDDCNAKVDDGPAPDFVPIDAQFYVYDGDDDDHAGLKGLGYTKLHICGFDIPTTAPTACTKLPLPCPLGTTADACCPPNGWKLAAGIPQDDCDDQSPSVFPGAPELCSTPVDDNCNGNANEGCMCKPGDTTKCSSTSTGQVITWPAGVPAGSCQYGSSVCGANGQFGQCNGAITPAGTDSCAIAGNDDNCNGTANDGCSCIDSPLDPSYVQPCSSLPDGTPIVWPKMVPVGSCKTGTQTCQSNGHYGQCVGAVAPLATDDCSVAGRDDNCNGVPNDACACIDSPGDPSYTKSCSALPDGTTITWPGGAPQGPCHMGTATCQANGTYGQCLGALAPLSADSCTVKGDDANCNGTANDLCTCVDVPGDPTYTETCNAFPDGTPIVFPGGTAQGTCKAGVAQCTSTGQYGPCNGAVAPQSADDCSVPGGRDTNCDGVIQCSCSPIGSTSTLVCSNQTGSCAGSIATCGPTGFGACSILPKAKDSCAVAGNDDDCNGVPNDPASCTCVAGATTTCSAQANGTPIIWPGGTPKGNCLYGTATCQSNGTFGACVGAVAPLPADSCTAKGDDANCNGVPNDPASCSCLDIAGDPSLHSQCSATPGGVPITWPTGAPAGACKYGSADCQTNGTYGQCNGAIGPTGVAGSVVCGSAGEGGSITITCPAGAVVVKVDFASYGRPTGSCNSYSQGSCNSPTSASVVQNLCLTKNTCTIPVNNTTFGDPCLNMVKTMDVQVECRGPDDCTSTPPVDANCDGIVSCACAPVGGAPTTAGCSNQTGSCAGATASCTATGYGPCSVVPAQYDSCNTVGNDDNCNGVPNEGCAHINGSSCGSAATCNQSAVWQFCKGDGTGCACSAPAPSNIGGFCNYPNDVSPVHGACAMGGIYQCTGPNSDTVACTGKRDARIGATTGQSSAAPWNGSWDWDCDNKITISGRLPCHPFPSCLPGDPIETDFKLNTGNVAYCSANFVAGLPFLNGSPPTSPSSNNVCLGSDAASCAGTEWINSCGAPDTACAGCAPGCGVTVTNFQCNWNAASSTCQYLAPAASNDSGKTWITACN